MLWYWTNTVLTVGLKIAKMVKRDVMEVVSKGKNYKAIENNNLHVDIMR